MAVTKIAQVDVGAGGAASIDFTSIPQTFTDLMLVLSLKNSIATTNSVMDLKINGLTASNYTWRTLLGSGSAASSQTFTSTADSGTSMTTGSTATANTFSNVSTYFPNYSATGIKSWSSDGVTENNATASGQQIVAVSYGVSIGGITSISITGNTWQQYSSATLYGITKGTSSGVTVA